MNAFLTELDLTPLSDGIRWQLISPFLYCVDLAADGEIIQIPSGFITDLASIPRFFWGIVPPFGQYDGAAIVHDYIYVNGGKLPGCNHVYTKAEADTIFRNAMRLEGVGIFKRTLMYLAVKFFGRGNFTV